MLDFGWQAVLPVAVNCRCQSTLPVSASRQRACSRFILGPDAAEMNTFLPNTIGDATLRPGRSTFQRTFSDGPQTVGRPVSSDTPEPAGPRNWGQSPATANPAATRNRPT